MYQFGSNCFSSQLSALTAQAAAESGRVVEHAGTAHVVHVYPHAGGLTYNLQPLDGGTATVLEIAQVPYQCQLYTYHDAGLIGGAIAAGWLGIFCIMSLLRARTGTDDA